jgi:hypothetical protein
MVASTDDINSTLQGIVRNLGLEAQFFSTLLAIALAPGQSLSTVTSPSATVVTALSTSSLQVIGSSSVRRGILFVNSVVGGTTIWLIPANATATTSRGIPLSGGSSYSTDAFLRNTAAWNAASQTSSGNALTIIEFF